MRAERYSEIVFDLLPQNEAEGSPNASPPEKLVERILAQILAEGEREHICDRL